MTRFEKHLAAYCVATINDDVDKRFRELNQLSKCGTSIQDWNLYLDLQDRFESENDLTADEARQIMRDMKR